MRLVGAFTRQPEAPWYVCVVIGALSAVVDIGGAIVLKLGDFALQLFYVFAIVYLLA